MKVSTARLFCFGGAAVTCLFAIAISDIHKAAADPWRAAPTHVTISQPPHLPSIERVILRDPFLAPNVPAAIGVRGPNGLAPGVVPMNGPGAPAGPMAVPNPGEILPTNATASVEIVGTVLGGGHPPAALALIGSQMQVVQIGDRIGGRTIAQIAAQGIIFADGTRLAIATAPPPSTASPAPEPTPTPYAPVNAPSPSPTPEPTVAPTPPILYRPVSLPGPFATPPSGPPPTVLSPGVPPPIPVVSP